MHPTLVVQRMPTSPSLARQGQSGKFMLAVMPRELDFTSSTTDEWEDELDVLDELVDLDALHCVESALGKVSLPPKAHFVPGKMVHLQLEGGSQVGHAMGGFVIRDMDRVEIIWAG